MSIKSHLTILFSALYLLITLATADLPTYTAEDADAYDTGALGRTPEQHFRTVRTPAYRLLRRSWDESQCSDPDSYLFVGVRGTRLAHKGPTIFDHEGHQVWNSGAFEKTYNFKVQEYKGENYLTWWNGLDAMGHGNGWVYMYDKHYNEHRRITAHGEDFTADLHEFTITPQNTAIITIYTLVPYDLTAYGGVTEAFIWDCLFQEISLETEEPELLFQWRASDYFTFEDCSNEYRAKGMTGTRSAWDWFHLNSVAKDDRGNYLISARYLPSLVYISGTTGEILWTLGGKSSNFTDLSEGRATDIFGQHSATWQDNYQSILLYDNHGNNWNHTIPSRAVKLSVDQSRYETKLIAEAYHPQGYITQSQGSVQQLPNGNIFVGYGFAGAMTEFTPDGKDVVCDWQYAPLHFGAEGGFSPGLIQSYRVFKMPWKGYPLQPPDVDVDEDGTFVHGHESEDENGGEDAGSAFYVSWNGATEQRTWVLEGTDLDDEDSFPSPSDSSSLSDTSNPNSPSQPPPETPQTQTPSKPGTWVKSPNPPLLSRFSLSFSRPSHNKYTRASIPTWIPLGHHPRQGFETRVPLYNNTYSTYRLTALDPNSKPLGMWVVRKNATAFAEEAEMTWEWRIRMAEIEENRRQRQQQDDARKLAEAQSEGGEKGDEDDGQIVKAHDVPRPLDIGSGVLPAIANPPPTTTPPNNNSPNELAALHGQQNQGVEQNPPHLLGKWLVIPIAIPSPTPSTAATHGRYAITFIVVVGVFYFASTLLLRVAKTRGIRLRLGGLEEGVRGLKYAMARVGLGIVRGLKRVLERDGAAGRITEKGIDVRRRGVLEGAGLLSGRDDEEGRL